MTGSLPYLLFRARDFRFGIRAGFVGEITRIVALDPFPGAQSHIRGIFSLRGKSVFALDLQGLLGLPEIPFGPDGRILIVQTPAALFGVMTHAVEGMTFLSPDEAERAAEIPGGLHLPGIHTVFNTAEGFIIELDPDSFVTELPLAAPHAEGAQLTIFDPDQIPETYERRVA